MSGPDNVSVHERWARFRFSVVGQLLAAPPATGALQGELNELAVRTWRHPVTGEPVRFGRSTIERWLYAARRESHNPVGALRRKVRSDIGAQGSVSDTMRAAIRQQYSAHPAWSIQLHYLNLRVVAENRPDIGAVPSYSTIRRFFKAQGLFKHRRLSSRRTEGAERAEQRLLEREV